MTATGNGPPPAALAQPQDFDAAAFFDAGTAARYDQAIRISCPAYEALHRMVAPWLTLLPADARFLSAGAGTGAEIVALARRFPGWRIDGVDASADMLRICEQRLAREQLAGRVELHHARLEDFRGAAPYDAASSVFVVNYIHGRERKLAYLRTLARQLKPGAILVLADLFGDPRAPDFIRLLRAWLLMCVAEGVRGDNLQDLVDKILRDIAFVPEHEVLALLGEAGFLEPVRFFQAYLYGGWVATRAAAQAPAGPGA
jgi:tRNA (cmo5U34)-methyltransferase